MQLTRDTQTMEPNKVNFNNRPRLLSALLMALLLLVALAGPQYTAASPKVETNRLAPSGAQSLYFKAKTIAPKSGDLDTTFGTNGMLNVDFGGSPDEAYGSVLQPDGKIVLVGDGYTDPDSALSSFTLIRLTATGALDTTFGNGGKVLSNFVAGRSAGARAVLLLPNGQLLVAGYSYNDSYYHNTFALARYNANGALDTTFGTSGVAFAPIEQGTGGNGPQDLATALALDANNNIVLVGYSGQIIMDFAAARFTADGKLDTTFADHGIYDKAISSDSRGAVVAIQPDGKIVIAGSAFGPGSYAEDFAMVRLLPNGAADTMFGDGGVVLTEFIGGSDYASGIALLPDGKIVLAGSGQLISPYGTDRFGTALAQYNADGTLDQSWGTGGRQLWEFGAGGGSAWGSGLVRLADGRLVQTGSYLNDYMMVNVYKADGTLDPGFAGTGSINVDFSAGVDRGNTVLVQPDGNIVAAGRAGPDGNQQLYADFGIIRVLGTNGQACDGYLRYLPIIKQLCNSR